MEFIIFLIMLFGDLIHRSQASISPASSEHVDSSVQISNLRNWVTDFSLSQVNLFSRNSLKLLAQNNEGFHEPFLFYLRYYTSQFVFIAFFNHF